MPCRASETVEMQYWSLRKLCIALGRRCEEQRIKFSVLHKNYIRKNGWVWYHEWPDRLQIPASASGTVPKSWNGVHRNFVARRNVRIQHACIKGGNRHLPRGVPLSWKRNALMMVTRNASEMSESNSMEMLLYVSFAVERIAQFVRAESLDTVGAGDADDSGITIGTMSGRTWLASSSFRACF